MTDARLPGRWLGDPTHDQLSDRAWRVHTSALMWSAEQGTDGLIPERTLRLLHPEGATLDDAQELVTLSLWARDGEAFRVLDWAKTQTLAAQVEWQRERNRLKNQALRDRERAKRVTGHGPSHVTGHVGGQDSDRTGSSSREITPIDIVQRFAPNTSADDDAAARAPEARHESEHATPEQVEQLTQLLQTLRGRAPSRQQITSWRGMSHDQAAGWIQHYERELETS